MNFVNGVPFKLSNFQKLAKYILVQSFGLRVTVFQSWFGLRSTNFFSGATPDMGRFWRFTVQAACPTQTGKAKI